MYCRFLSVGIAEHLLADFIPSPRDRARARKVLAATAEMIAKAHDVLDGQVDEKVRDAEAEALKTLGGSSTSSPASSA